MTLASNSTGSKNHSMVNTAPVWVDTDFGFDDLWALLLLRYLNVQVAGVSLVCGNATLARVSTNAYWARQQFELPWPIYQGAAAPLQCPLQTAEPVLGPSGMQTRELSLPETMSESALTGIEKGDDLRAFSKWLETASSPTVLAIGPLTNIATYQRRLGPQFFRIDKIVWMGGSAGRGNHTVFAEFNAHADPEALEVVLQSGVPVDIVDLELCRQVSFNESHTPQFNSACSASHHLLQDLLGGYLDIALNRGRNRMNIYDPLAALALDNRVSFEYQSVEARVDLSEKNARGRTRFTASPESVIRLATLVDRTAARDICMKSLEVIS